MIEGGDDGAGLSGVRKNGRSARPGWKLQNGSSMKLRSTRQERACSVPSPRQGHGGHVAGPRFGPDCGGQVVLG